MGSEVHITPALPTMNGVCFLVRLRGSQMPVPQRRFMVLMWAPGLRIDDALRPGD